MQANEKNILAIKNPQLASEWHPTKNENLTPNDVGIGSKKKVWWLGNCGHEWLAIVSGRNNGNGCPYCSNQKILENYNDLATINKELAKEWNYEKNKDLLPTMISRCSEKKVWWKCSLNHEWQATVHSRNVGKGCPICSKRKQTSMFEYILFYYFRQVDNSVMHSYNELGFELDIFIPSKNIGIEYDGEYFHKNIQTRDIKKNKQCLENNIKLYRIREKLPSLNSSSIDITCNNNLDEIIHNLIKEIYNKEINIDIKRDEIEILNLRELSELENSLANKFPNIAKEWHPIKNKNLLPTMFSYGSGQNVWWLGNCGHEWKTTILNRTTGKQGCPYCSNNILLNGYNDLETNNSELAKEWHPRLNGDLKPNMISPNSHTKVWWLGKCGHEWDDTPLHRNRGVGCPYCNNKRILKGYNDLETLNQKLAKEWHPILNGDLLPSMVSKGSGKKVWWKCGQGHEWQAEINSRNKGAGCPYCRKRKQI